MRIKDRFFGKLKKQPDDNDNPPTTDIQLSPAIETSSEANKGFFQQIWNKFRKHSHSEQKTSPDMELTMKEVETTTNKQSDKKNRLQSIIQKIWRNDDDVPAESPTQTSIEEVKPHINEETQTTNPNKLKKLFNQLTKKEEDEIQTVEAIEQVDKKLETASNSNKIKNIFHQLVKSANPQDIQKIAAKLPSMNRGQIKEIWPKIQSLFQMAVDPKVAWKSKALAIGSLLYLISPFDAIPDIIPFVGLADDAAVIISVVSTLAFELSKYAKQSASKGIEVAEQLADIEVRKYNRIVKITLTGSIIAAILAIAVKIILKHI
ncbi:YkvA family protein [Plectonema radiosum]|nr:YkvA family protein [Plectonema radiosum]